MKGPSRLLLRALERFPVRSGLTTAFRGQSIWLAMPHRLPRLASRSPCLASRRPLPPQSDSRRADSRGKPACCCVACSVRISFPSGSSCSLSHSIWLSLYAMLAVLLSPHPAALSAGASGLLFA
jgi:hypothetical protein